MMLILDVLVAPLGREAIIEELDKDCIVNSFFCKCCTLMQWGLNVFHKERNVRALKYVFCNSVTS